MKKSKTTKKAVILCSGGMDSATVMALAKAEGYDLYALSFRYGQRHAVELEKAAGVAEHFQAKEHLVLALDLGKMGGSALTDDTLPVPKGRNRSEIDEHIPITYVPARNTIFLSYALAWAEVLGAEDIFIGVNALDYSGYPDCRPEYIAAFEQMSHLATRAGVEGDARFKIRAPLIYLSKGEIIQKGLELGVDYGLTHSCYDPLPDGRSCGRCDSCLLQAQRDLPMPGQ